LRGLRARTNSKAKIKTAENRLDLTAYILILTSPVELLVEKAEEEGEWGFVAVQELEGFQMLVVTPDLYPQVCLA
jgi:hypothetical protein